MWKKLSKIYKTSVKVKIMLTAVISNFLRYSVKEILPDFYLHSTPIIDIPQVLLSVRCNKKSKTVELLLFPH